MAVRGRKPKPVALKILEGYQASRTNFAEPRIPAASVKAPSWLKGHALTKWKELAPLLAAAGMFTEGDRSALEQLCDDYSIIRTESCPKAKDRYRRLLTEFGLTPSSRSRLKSTLEPPKDALAAHLDRAKKKA